MSSIYNFDDSEDGGAHAINGSISSVSSCKKRERSQLPSDCSLHGFPSDNDHVPSKYCRSHICTRRDGNHGSSVNRDSESSSDDVPLESLRSKKCTGRDRADFSVTRDSEPSSDDQPLDSLRSKKCNGRDGTGGSTVTRDSESSSDDIPLGSLRTKKSTRRDGNDGSTVTRDSESSSDDVPLESLRSKKSRLKNLPELGLLHSVYCCIYLCMGALGLEEMQKARDHFQSLSKGDQRTWVLEYIDSHSKDQQSELEICYIIGTTTVCMVAWRLILGLSESTLKRILSKFKGGQRTKDFVSSWRKERLSVAAESSKAWLDQYIKLHGDRQPTDNKVHLPSSLTKFSLYHDMVTELEHDGDDFVSLSHFYKLWDKYFPHVTIPSENRFAKCDVCTKISTRLGQTTNKKERQALEKHRDTHLEKQGKEREKYYSHRRKGKGQQKKYLSIILDGMDQQKTSIPHYHYLFKSLQKMQKLRTHLTGALAHGHATFGYFDLGLWGHGPDITANVLLATLASLSYLPDVLYLQMDNCWRENKNMVVFGLCALLVELKVFRKVKVGFLMVGHTHEDVDQVFSRFSEYLKRHSANSLPKLMQSFRNSIQPPPISRHLHKLYGVSQWLKPHLNVLRHHSVPHQFKFERDDSAKCVLFAKKWSTDAEWTPADFNTETGRYLLKSLPSGTPGLVKPSFEKLEIHKLKSSFATAKKFMPLEEDKEWWSEFFDEVDSYDEELQDTDDWYMTEILSIVQNRTVNDSDEYIEERNSDIEEEEREMRPLIIGNVNRKLDSALQRQNAVTRSSI